MLKASNADSDNEYATVVSKSLEIFLDCQPSLYRYV